MKKKTKKTKTIKTNERNHQSAGTKILRNRNKIKNKIKKIKIKRIFSLSKDRIEGIKPNYCLRLDTNGRTVEAMKRSKVPIRYSIIQIYSPLLR